MPDEIELFSRMANGDEAAFTKIFYYYEPRIFPFVIKLTGSETIAREIVQELFLTLWQRRALASTIENPRAYIFKMAVNKTATWMKKGARKTFIEKDASSQLAAVHDDVSEKIAVREMDEILNKMVDQLPPQQKLVYQLNRQQGFKNEEIAKQLNLSEKTVRNHLSKALKTIRKDLKNYPEISLTILLIVMKMYS